MVADGLGIPVEEITETIQPVIATEGVKNEFLEVKAGQVAGVHQVACGLAQGKEKVYLELQMYVGAKASSDTVELTGEPNLKLTVPGGIHGDFATAAVAVNCIPSMAEVRPGLRTSRDIPMSYVPGEPTP
jgi:4-hydroxy-tetrahydrodipicolinate reductase